MKRTAIELTGSGMVAVLGVWCLAAPAPPATKPKERAPFNAHKYGVRNLAFSPDGQTLATSGDDATIKLWDTASGKNTATWQAHTGSGKGGLDGRIFAVTFSPNGKTLASIGGDMTARLWDVTTGKNTLTLKLRGWPSQLGFSPDGQTLVTDVTLWDLKTQQERAFLKGLPGFGPVVAFDLGGKILIAAKNNHPAFESFFLWDTNTGRKAVTYKGHTKPVFHLAFSRDGKTLASTGRDQTVRLWDVATGKNTRTINLDAGLAGCPAFSSDGKSLAVSCIPGADRNDYPGTIRLLEVSSGRLLATLTGHKRPIGCLAFSPNGRLLASGDGEGKIKLWDLPSRWATARPSPPPSKR